MFFKNTRSPPVWSQTTLKLRKEKEINERFESEIRYEPGTIKSLRLRITNLLFRLKYFSRIFFCPAKTYSGRCSSGHPCMNIMSLVAFLGLGGINSEKHSEVRRSPQKICKLVLQDLIYLKGATLVNRLTNYVAISEQQNCSNSIWKLAWDLKVRPLDCARSAVHTEPNYILGPL